MPVLNWDISIVSIFCCVFHVNTLTPKALVIDTTDDDAASLSFCFEFISKLFFAGLGDKVTSIIGNKVCSILFCKSNFV